MNALRTGMTILMVVVMIAWVPGGVVASVAGHTDADVAAIQPTADSGNGGAAPTSVRDRFRSVDAADVQDRCGAVSDRERIRMADQPGSVPTRFTGSREDTQELVRAGGVVSETDDEEADALAKRSSAAGTEVAIDRSEPDHDGGDEVVVGEATIPDLPWNTTVHPAVPTTAVGAPDHPDPSAPEETAPSQADAIDDTDGSTETERTHSKSRDEAGNRQVASRTTRQSSSQTQTGEDNDQEQRRTRTQRRSQSQRGSNNHQAHHQSIVQQQAQRQSGSGNDQSQRQSVTQEERQRQG